MDGLEAGTVLRNQQVAGHRSRWRAVEFGDTLLRIGALRDVIAALVDTAIEGFVTFARIFPARASMTHGCKL